jgi:hypothetical protein
MPRRPPKTMPGTCSRCHRQVNHKLLKRVRVHDAHGGTRTHVYLCPVCFVPTHLSKKRTKGASPTSTAMADYKSGALAPDPPADPPRPMHRVRPIVCSNVGCRLAAQWVDNGRPRCFAHRTASAIPIELAPSSFLVPPGRDPRRGG